MCQPPRRRRNTDKGLFDGLERTGGEQRGFHGAVDGAASEREPINTTAPDIKLRLIIVHT